MIYLTIEILLWKEWNWVLDNKNKLSVYRIEAAKEKLDSAALGTILTVIATVFILVFTYAMRGETYEY